jgi:hypothetical protein
MGPSTGRLEGGGDPSLCRPQICHAVTLHTYTGLRREEPSREADGVQAMAPFGTGRPPGPAARYLTGASEASQASDGS